jgi:putative peptidoglycan lipid II flippase
MATPSIDSRPEPDSPVPPPEKERAAGAKTLGLVSLAILASRLLGLVREMFIGSLFGGTQRKWMDAFNMAFRMPNMLRDLFAEGALSTAFVTVFSKKMKTEGDEAAWLLAQRMATLTAVFMSGISLLGVLFAPWVMMVMAPGWLDDKEKFEFTVLLARIMYPFILLVSLGALVMGMLNAKKVFGMPAMASTFFNLGSIISGGLLGWLIDPNWGKLSLIGFAIGTLVGGLAQLTCQFPALRRVGFPWKINFGWKDDGVRQILRLMGPALISGGAVQINVWLNNVFATAIDQDGPVSWLGFAFRLMQLPLGLFGVAVATITLPTLARQALEGATGDFRNTLAKGMRLTFFLTIPSAVGLALLADPIISVIYERGRFDAFDTAQTAAALRYYALGLVFYSGIKILQPAFYAIDKRHFPMVVSLIAIGVSAGLNAILVLWLKQGHASLAMTTAVIASLNFMLLFFGMRHQTKHLEDHFLLQLLLRLLLAVGLMAAVCVAGKIFVMGSWESMGTLQRVFGLGMVIALAGATYFVICVKLGVEESKEFLALVKRRVGRGKPTP